MTRSMITLPLCAVDKTRLGRIDTQTVVSVSSPSASSFAWKKVCMILGFDAHIVPSCVSELRVCTCTSFMTSGGHRGAVTDLLINSHD